MTTELFSETCQHTACQEPIGRLGFRIWDNPLGEPDYRHYCDSCGRNIIERDPMLHWESISGIKAEQFKRELRALLTTYDYGIYFSCDAGSDTYGLTGDCMKVTDSQNNTILEVDGWGLIARDIQTTD